MNTAKADLIVKQALLAHKRSARLVNRGGVWSRLQYIGRRAYPTGFGRQAPRGYSVEFVT